MVYDMSFVGNMTGPAALFTGVNTLTGGLMGMFLLIFIMTMTLILSMKRYDDFKLSLVISSAVGTFFGPLLWIAELIPFWVAIMPLPLFLLSLLAAVVWRRDA